MVWDYPSPPAGDYGLYCDYDDNDDYGEEYDTAYEEKRERELFPQCFE